MLQPKPNRPLSLTHLPAFHHTFTPITWPHPPPMCHSRTPSPPNLHAPDHIRSSLIVSRTCYSAIHMRTIRTEPDILRPRGESWIGPNWCYFVHFPCSKCIKCIKKETAGWNFAEHIVKVLHWIYSTILFFYFHFAFNGLLLFFLMFFMSFCIILNNLGFESLKHRWFYSVFVKLWSNVSEKKKAAVKVSRDLLVVKTFIAFK